MAEENTTIQAQELTTTCCHKCGIPETKDNQFQRCSRCKSVFYCGRDCQKADWKSHKSVCCDSSNQKKKKKKKKASNNQLMEPTQQYQQFQMMTDQLKKDPFFQYFFTSVEMMMDLEEEEEDEGDKVTQMSANKQSVLEKMADEMRKILQQDIPQSEHRGMLFNCIPLLTYMPNTKVIWEVLPTNPLKIVLEVVDPNVISGPSGGGSDGKGSTALHWIAETAEDPSNILVNDNQIQMARCLLEAGANVNARAQEKLTCCTPLHRACHSANKTNFNMIQLLLEHGANPNALNTKGETPLHHAMCMATDAAKFVIEFCEQQQGLVVVQLNIKESRGWSVLKMAQDSLEESSYIYQASGGNPHALARAQRMREFVDFLVARRAAE